MSKDGITMTTPVGRLIWGSVSTPRAKTHQDGAQRGQPVIDATTGQPVMEISFGLAIPKEATVRANYPNNPNIEQIVRDQSFEHAVWPSMAQEIATVYPNIPQRFSFKYKDGDTALDANHQPLRDREGYAGHIVLAYTQRVNEYFTPPALCKFNPATGTYTTLQPDEIKNGYYVAVGTHFKCEAAQGTNTPSIYVNPKAVELVGYGPIIASDGVNIASLFGGQARALPPGASATPTQQPGAAAMPGMGAPPPVAPGGMPGMPAMAPVAPPPAPAPVAPPPPPAGPTRPTEPSHIHAAGTPGEQWWINGTWVPAVAAPALPAPATDFVAAAGYTMPGGAQMPGMPAPR